MQQTSSTPIHTQPASADERLIEMWHTISVMAARSPKHFRPSAWTGHVPFLQALISLQQPRRFVELGVHAGMSFLTACDVARYLNLECECVGVDSWQGDEHAGFYEGDRLYADLSQIVERDYPCARLMRCLFDEARASFPAGSIDLLHIDGLHTFEAVKHDLDTWIDSLSPQGIILFHDINVYERSFGVHVLWRQLKETQPHLTFYHQHGLGVLFVGDAPAERIRQFNDLRSSVPVLDELLRETCERFGEILVERFSARESAGPYEDFVRRVRKIANGGGVLTRRLPIRRKLKKLLKSLPQ